MVVDHVGPPGRWVLEGHGWQGTRAVEPVDRARKGADTVSMSRLQKISTLVVVALVVAACGSGSTDDGSKGTTAPASVAGTEPPVTTGESPNGATTVTDGAATTATTGAPVEVDGPIGSREAPVALGSLGRIGDWLIRVTDIDPDAADELLASDSFLDPPEEGNRYVLIEVEGTYVGEGSGNLWSDFFYNAVGGSNVAYDEFDDSCGFLDGDLSALGDVFSGGTVRGLECFEVEAADVADLQMFLEPGGFGFGDDARLFFALQEGVGGETGLALPGAPDVAAGGEIGERGNPIALGNFVQIGDWYVAVHSADLDATDEVLAQNSFNEPPVDGDTYVMAGVELAYVGSESASFWSDGFSWSAVGPTNVAVDPFESSCGLIDHDLSNSGELFPNGRVTGSLCLTVTAAEVGEMLLFFDVFGEDRRFFGLQPGIGSPTDVVVPTVEVELDTAAGSRGNPIPLGTSAALADWEVAVTGVDRDATEVVMGESSFNEPPAEGNVFVLIDLEVTYLGADSSSFWADAGWSLLGPDLVARNSFEAGCGSIPDDISFADEVFAGGTVSGKVCFEVPEETVGDLALIVDAFASFDPDDRIFFDLG
jgi:hypothetical protein